MNRQMLRRAINLDRRERDLQRKREARAEKVAELEALRAITPDPPPRAAALAVPAGEVERLPYPELAQRRVRAPLPARARLRVLFKANPEVFFHDYPKKPPKRHEGGSQGHVLIGIEDPPMPSHWNAKRIANLRRSR